MELKKWIAVVGVGVAIGGALMVRGVVQTTVPATQPMSKAATLPTTMTSEENPGSSQRDKTGRDRNSRRGSRGNRDSSVPSATLTGATDAYAVLKTRSIFLKGNQTIASVARPSGNPLGPSGPLAGRLESLLVFNGVILVNEEADALVEDRGSGNVVKVRPGDAIAGGRVSSITFDDLAYEHGGKTLHVSIGQNLEGNFASDAPVPGPATMPIGTPGGTPPAAGVVSPPGSTGEISADDIVAKLKARRLKESGGK